MTIFWYCESILLFDFLPRGTTINDPYYASILHQLHSPIREKQREKLMRGMLLLHDNASVHKSNIIQTAVQYIAFTELDHPAHSSDIAPSDYYLLLNVKNFLRSRNFQSDEMKR